MLIGSSDLNFDRPRQRGRFFKLAVIANQCSHWCGNPLKQEEFSMICTVIDIRGDYAYVKYQDTGIVSEVALALLPWDIDVGDKLKFEDYTFEKV